MNEDIELFRKELLEAACFKEKTVNLYIGLAAAYISYAKKSLKITPDESRPSHINTWFSHLKSKGKSNHFLKGCRASLGHFFSLLVKSGRSSANPVEHAAPIKIPRSVLNKPISRESAFAILRSLDRPTAMGRRDHAIFSLLYALGLRVNELLSLKLCDIKMDYDSKHRIGTLLVHGKGGKERTLFIVDRLYDVLASYLRRKKGENRPNSALFEGQCNKPLFAYRVRQFIKEAAFRAGITERVTPHVLRHTFATEMYNRNVPVEAIKEMMGHASIKETSPYIHVSEALQSMVLEKIGIKEETP